MKRNIFSFLVLGTVLFTYACLYIATSRNPCPNDDCDQFYGIDSSLRALYPPLAYSYRCKTNMYCMRVKDAGPQNWKGLADTACMYLEARGFTGFSVAVLSTLNSDTLLTQNCP